MNLLFKNGRCHVLSLLALAALFYTAGCSSPETSSSALSTAATPAHDSIMMRDGGDVRGDVLRVGDPISIRFSGVTVSEPPPPVDERLKSDGTIRLPLIPTPVSAEGKTRGQLEEEIYKLYVPKYFKTLTVKVGSEGRTVYVGGEVRIQGRVQYMGRMTVLSAVTAAGGFTDFANRRNVEVTRASGRKEKVNCIKAQQDPKYDPPVYPDDRIEVRRRLW